MKKPPPPVMAMMITPEPGAGSRPSPGFGHLMINGAAVLPAKTRGEKKGGAEAPPSHTAFLNS
jgi:hypothetical protein